MTAVRIRIVRCTCNGASPDARLCECEGSDGTTPITIECDTFEQAVDLLVGRLPEPRSSSLPGQDGPEKTS